MQLVLERSNDLVFYTLKTCIVDEHDEQDLEISTSFDTLEDALNELKATFWQEHDEQDFAKIETEFENFVVIKIDNSEESMFSPWLNAIIAYEYECVKTKEFIDHVFEKQIPQQHQERFKLIRKDLERKMQTAAKNLLDTPENNSSLVRKYRELAKLT